MTFGLFPVLCKYYFYFCNNSETYFYLHAVDMIMDKNMKMDRIGEDCKPFKFRSGHLLQ